ncbi:tyrosine-type recombinase/integrase [Bradyrhizobium sp. HKCCYLS20291]|uniref:tyrosine-type recombinase/integrase n=1 Tax=Bradyrhizobium sp. HKCCYLS20291 TaxID=3420766 RepID=UPI003EBCCA24
MPKLLTVQIIEGLKTEDGKRVDVPDPKCPGLSIRVTANGVKSWSFRYRPPLASTVARVTLGRWPSMSIAEARQAANKHREHVGQGRDPRAVVRQEKMRAGGGPTFDAVADLFLSAEKKGGKGPRSTSTTEAYTATLAREGGPRELWGRWPIGTITRADVTDYLRGVEKVGKIAANRQQAMLASLFNYAVREGKLEANPIAGVGKRNAERVRTRSLNDVELAAVWRELLNVESPHGLIVRCALRLLLLTGCRVSEVSDFPRKEIVESEPPVWWLSRERTKNGRDLRIPIVPAIGDVIADVTRHVETTHGKATEWVFPAAGLFDRPTSRYALRDACAAIAERLELPSFSPHDLRRTWTVVALRSGVAPHVVEAQLNHAKPGGGGLSIAVGGAFANYGGEHDYLEERRDALTRVAAHIVAAK